MTIKNSDPRRGYFTFVHHDGDMCIEFSENIDERIAYIKANKPENEIETRLKCLTYVPETLIPEGFAEALQDWLIVSADFTISEKSEIEAANEYLKIASSLTSENKVNPDYLRILEKAREIYIKRLYNFNRLSDKLSRTFRCYWKFREELQKIAFSLVPDVPWDEERKCLVFKEEN